MEEERYTPKAIVVTEELIREAFDKVEKEMGPLPYMEQIAPGLWEISSGGKNPIICHTGEGGAEAFREAMRDEAKRSISEIETSDKFLGEPKHD